MLNPSLDAYGSGKTLATVQKLAGGPSALAALDSAKGVTASVSDKQLVAQINKSDLDAAVKKLNEFVAPALQTIEFSMDEESERMIVKVVDTATRTVLRQIPNEEVLAISKTLDKLQGLVIRQTA